MAYQPCTIEGDDGFSKVNSPPTRSGVVACISGEAWVRLLKTAATGVTSGVNADLVAPDAPPFTDGWYFLGAGDTMTFGIEQVHETAGSEPVAQIDVYCIDALVVINQH